MVHWWRDAIPKRSEVDLECCSTQTWRGMALVGCIGRIDFGNYLGQNFFCWQLSEKPVQDQQPGRSKNLAVLPPWIFLRPSRYDYFWSPAESLGSGELFFHAGCGRVGFRAHGLFIGQQLCFLDQESNTRRPGFVDLPGWRGKLCKRLINLSQPARYLEYAG